MPTYDATEAHRHISPEQLEAFKKTIADAEAEGKELVSVIVMNGTPLVYNIRDKN